MCLELAPESTEIRATWTEAMMYCFSMGPGWRLPTKQELIQILREEENDLNGWYWTSTRATIEDNRYWSVVYFNVNLGDGMQEKLKKIPSQVKLDVRAVREL